MEAFTRLEAIACPLGAENVDTDQLIPARFMSRSRAEGYGRYLLHDLRFADDGASRRLIIDAPRYAGARVLVARRNFGTGSSREAAVYALWDFGIRCVIAPSFGDIFASNAVKNGLLPATVTSEDAEALLAFLADAASPRLTIDLEAMTISTEREAYGFTLDPVRRLQLLNGWDDIDLTNQHRAAIRDYRNNRERSHPWAFPSAVSEER